MPRISLLKRNINQRIKTQERKVYEDLNAKPTIKSIKYQGAHIHLLKTLKKIQATRHMNYDQKFCPNVYPVLKVFKK